MTNKKPRIEVVPIEQGATPDPNNVNKHTVKGGAILENSLKRRGAFRSIASAGKNTDIPVTYAGNYTLEKAVDAGFTEVINIHVTGDQLVNVVRDDIEPGTPEAIALGLEDNESAKQSYNPDVDLLAALATGERAILAGIKKQDGTFERMLGAMGQLGAGMMVVDDPNEFGGAGRTAPATSVTVVGLGRFRAAMGYEDVDKSVEKVKAKWGEDPDVALPALLKWIIENL